MGGLLRVFTGLEFGSGTVEPAGHFRIQFIQLQRKQALAAKVVECHHRRHNVMAPGLRQQRAIIALAQIFRALTQVDDPDTGIGRCRILQVLIKTEQVFTGVVRCPVLGTVNNKQ